MNFEQWLAAKGLESETLSDAMRTTLQAAWRAEVNPSPGGGGGKKPEDDYEKTMEGFRQEEERVKRITRMTAEAIEASPNRREEMDAIGRKAIANKWDDLKTENALLRAGRPDAPTQLTTSAGTPSALVLEAAFAQATGLRSVEKEYPEKVLEAAFKQYGGGLTICTLMDVVARQNGYRGTVPTKVNMEKVMRFAFRNDMNDGDHIDRRQDSGVSTISISGILSNVGNKKVRDSFNSVDQAWREIAAIGSVSDFKTMTSYSLTGDMVYKEIAPGGFIDHATLGEVSYTNQAKSFGRMLGLDRRDLINDNAGALDKVYNKMGRGGAIALNKYFWGKFLNNSSFFSVGNANVSTGAGSALGLAGLKAADGVFAVQTDPDGNLLGTTPTILLVPSALRVDAWNLVNSTDTNATTTADAPIPARNPFTGKFKAVHSAYLQDSTLTGYSAAAWYLLADPMDMPVIEVVFLFGRQIPLVTSTDADFNQEGLQVKGVHDFGAELQEKRGGVRSAGS